MIFVTEVRVEIEEMLILASDADASASSYQVAAEDVIDLACSNSVGPSWLELIDLAPIAESAAGGAPKDCASPANQPEARCRPHGSALCAQYPADQHSRRIVQCEH